MPHAPQLSRRGTRPRRSGPQARLGRLAERGEASDRDSLGSAVLGAGPAGLTSAWVLARARAAGDRARGRRVGRRDRQDGRVRRLSLRPRRASLLHQAAAGQAPLGGDARRRAADPSAAVADLLPRQVLRLPARRPGGLSRSRRDRIGALRGVVSGTRGGGCAACGRRPSRTGSSGASGAASTTPSFAPTPRRCGASRGPRSRPSGPRSGSRTSASGRRCSASSGCAAVTRRR